MTCLGIRPLAPDDNGTTLVTKPFVRKSKRVLIVDDDESVVRLIGSALQDEGIAVDGAANGVEALERMSRESYAILLVDLAMPLLDGPELMRKIGEVVLRLPVIYVISGDYRRFEDRLDSQLINGVIRKPFDLREVVALVRSTLARVA